MKKIVPERLTDLNLAVLPCDRCGEVPFPQMHMYPTKTGLLCTNCYPPARPDYHPQTRQRLTPRQVAHDNWARLIRSATENRPAA